MYGQDAESIFSGIPQGVGVRALLRYEDLMLLREVFVWYARYNQDVRYDLSNNDVVRLQTVMRRMLRKGGSECYSK
jgi:hypothetical protein